jgi:glycosyltransferase involved in cell wall biosynthesis
MRSPFFSIIIATYQRPKLLRRAVQSIRTNTFSDVELIIVSHDNDLTTLIEINDLLQDADHFIKRPGRPIGPAESRNVGIEKSQGHYILFLDDDDTLASDYLENEAIELHK